MERSSIAVLDEAKILLSTPGVTGMRPLDEGGPRGTLAYERFSSDEPVEEAGMSIAVCCASTRLTQVWLAQGYKPVRFMLTEQERKEKKKKGEIRMLGSANAVRGSIQPASAATLCKASCPPPTSKSSSHSSSSTIPDYGKDLYVLTFCQ